MWRPHRERLLMCPGRLRTWLRALEVPHSVPYRAPGVAPNADFSDPLQVAQESSKPRGGLWAIQAAGAFFLVWPPPPKSPHGVSQRGLGHLVSWLQWAGTSMRQIFESTTPCCTPSTVSLRALCKTR